VKHDEALLWSMFPTQFRWPRDAASIIGMPFKRLIYLTESKWPRQKVYEYGCVCDLGWKINGADATRKTAYAESILAAARGEAS
jgi:hypothetical protein